MPDGRRTFFMMSGGKGLASLRTDGQGSAMAMDNGRGAFGPMVSDDGQAVVFQRPSPGGGWSIWRTSPSGEHAPSRVIADTFVHYMPSISPDGKWLAEVSTMSGQVEVYARPFPDPGAAVQISEGGGTEPAWASDGRRIYYRAKGAFMAATVEVPSLTVTTRRELFKDVFDGAMPHRNYDVLPHGAGFLMITGGSSEAIVVLNWITELRQELARHPQ